MEEITKEMQEVFEKFMDLRDNVNGYNNRYLAQPNELHDQLPFTKLGLGMQQINVIFLLYHGPMSIGEIAKSEGVSKQLITQPINSLTRQGILRRFQKPDNFRFVYVELTDYGRRIYDEQIAIRSNYLMEKFYSIASLEEIRHLVDFLEYYKNVLQRFDTLAEKESEENSQTCENLSSPGDGLSGDDAE